MEVLADLGIVDQILAGGGVAHIHRCDLSDADDIDRVVLAGMGGSSLAPEVFASMFSDVGRRDLAVLDSTHPDAVTELLPPDGLDTTLVIVSSKSGTTAETRAFALHAERHVPSTKHLVAITDPGSNLAEEAVARVAARAVALVGQEVQKAVRAHLDVADAADRAPQQPLLPDHALALTERVEDLGGLFREANDAPRAVVHSKGDHEPMLRRGASSERREIFLVPGEP